MEPTSSQGGIRSALRTGSHGESYKSQSHNSVGIQSPPSREQQTSSYLQQQPSYELNRGEDLRRQIREKEAELENITKNKDKIRLRMNQNNSSLNREAPMSDVRQPLRQEGSAIDIRNLVQQSLSPPAHTRDQPSASQASSIQLQQIQNLSRPMFTPSTPHMSQNPLKSTIKPEFQNLNQSESNFSQPLMSQPLRSGGNFSPPQSSTMRVENINQLAQENQQLQRRLNLVSQELDRVQGERDEVQTHYLNICSQSDHLQNQVDLEERDNSPANQLQENIDAERDLGKKMRDRLHDSENQSSDIQNQLRALKNERQRTVQITQDLSGGLNNKLAVMKELESQQFFNQTKIDEVDKQIDAVAKQLDQDHHNQHALANVLDRLTNDRNDLQQKLHHLNQTYDQTVEEISRERTMIQMNNRRHLQLLASKVLCLSLQQMGLVRRQTTFSELVHYCKFDQHCHNTLKTYSGILEKCGHFKMKIALKVWFQNAMKPLQTRSTCSQLVLKLYKAKLRTKMFMRWRAKLALRQQAYQNKIDGLHKIWNYKSKDVSKDIKRAFAIWRMKSFKNQTKETRLRLIIRRQETALMQQALVLWQDYICQVDTAIRQHVLTQHFTQKQLLNIAMNQLKDRVLFKRRIRLIKLKHIVKAWKDSLAYRKYIMAQTVAAEHLQKQLKKRLMSNCFHYLRQSKEQDKIQLVTDKLYLEVMPKIHEVVNVVNSKSEKSLRDKKLRALRAMSKQGEVFLSSYFEKWLEAYKGKQFKFRKNVKEVMLRRYKQLVHTAFDVWRHGTGHKKRTLQTVEINDLQFEQIGLNTEVSELKTQVQKESSRISRATKAAFTRASKIYHKMMLMNGLHTWADRVKQWQGMDTHGAGAIFRLMRKNYLTQAFKIYQSKVYDLRQDMRSEERADYYIKTRQARMVRRVYNAICQYVHCYNKARLNLKTMITNMDLWLQRKLWIKWVDQGNRKKIQFRRETQNQHTEKFDQINENLGRVVRKHTEAEEENNRWSRKLLKEANRVLSNYFARFYYTKAHRGIKKWADYVKFQKHREEFFKRTLLQQKKSMFYVFKASFQNWIAQCKHKELRAETKHSAILAEDEERLIEYRRMNHVALVDQILSEISKKQIEAKDQHKKFLKVVEMIINKNDVYNYQSKQRFVFGRWRQFTKRQKHFVQTTIKVLQKSMWQNGFSNIAAFSRDKERTRLQNRVLGLGMRRMYYKKACAYYFSKWRETRYARNTNRVEEVETIVETKTVVHENFVHKTKEWTGAKGRRIRQRINIANVLRAWKTVTQWQRTQKVQTSAHKDYMQNWHACRAFKKWHEREQITKKYRSRMELFKQKRKMIYQQAVFFSLRALQGYQRQFATKFSDLAGKFDYLMKLIAMKRITNFAEIKGQADREQKQVAARDLGAVISQMYYRKMLQHLSELRMKVQKQKSRHLRISSMFGHWFGRGLRNAFFKWKNKTICAETAETVNDQGPIVEEVLHWQLRYENMRHILRDEGYTPLEIQRITVWAAGRGRQLIAKSIARMHHYTERDDKYLKPKMFDRWRLYVQIRKLIRYLMRNMQNALQPLKSDLSVAFNRWKESMSPFKKYGRYRKDLVEQCARNQRRRTNLQIVLGQAGEFKEQMQLQRDELVDKYIKSQRLAIAAGRDNHERGQTLSLNKLSDHARKCKNRDLEEVLQRNIDFINQLKDKIQEFENDNVSVANENEDLRQFSLNGYQIAKNVQSLQQERESLSVDLADKAHQIRNLLNQNEALTHTLHNIHSNNSQIPTAHQTQSIGNPMRDSTQDWNQRASVTDNY